MCKELLVYNMVQNVLNINYIFMCLLKILQWRSLINVRRYTLLLSKPSSILIIKVKVYRSRSEDAETRRKKEMASGIHHNAVTKASADDTF